MRVEFKNGLSVDELPVECNWELRRPFYTYIYDEDEVYELIVPEGFVTDFCSVPRLPFAYLLFGNIANRAGVVHDALYSSFAGIELVSLYDRVPYKPVRSWCDEVLKAGLAACGVDWVSRNAMWAGVRLNGQQYFKPQVNFLR